MNPDKVIHIKCEAKSYYQLDELNHFQGNLKSIDKDRFDKLKKSLISDGLPIGFHVWIDKKKKVWTIDGHHRVLALKALREEGYDVPSLPCVIVQAKDKKEAAKAVLINNSKYAKINQDSLSDFMIDFELNLDDLNFLDLPDLNMDDFGLDEKTKEGLTDDDDVPEVAQNIHGVTLGDIYTLGNHRLMCGDSTSIDAVEKLMDGQKADMLFTDPPYGDNHASMEMDLEANKIGKSIVKKSNKISSDENLDFLMPAMNCAQAVLKDNSTKIVFFKWKKWNEIIEATAAFGEPSSCCVWDRISIAAATFRFNPVHEFVFHWGNLSDKRSKSNLTNVWRCKKELENKVLHPTVKPIEIIEPAIEVCTDKGNAILDLFGGSGSTLIACEKTNRKCFMMELDPHYCSVIIERWQNFTGLKAKLITE